MRYVVFNVFIILELLSFTGCTNPFSNGGDTSKNLGLYGPDIYFEINNYSENDVNITANMVSFKEGTKEIYRSFYKDIKANSSKRSIQGVYSEKDNYELVIKFISDEEYKCTGWNIDDYYDNDIDLDGLSWTNCLSEQDCHFYRKDSNASIIEYPFDFKGDSDNLILHYQVDIYNENNISVKFLKSTR